MSVMRKKGEKNVQKAEYLKIENSFLGKIKSIFHDFLSAFFW